MRCIGCGHENPATVSYCQKCGQHMDLTAEEIRAALVEKAKAETARHTEWYARQSLIFAIVLFLIALTALVATGGAPEDRHFIPSASQGAEARATSHRT